MNRRLLALLLTASVLPAACTGSLFQSKATVPTVYLLSANLGPAPALPAVTAADLAILRPRIRRGLESDHIAVLYSDRRLDYFADGRWSGPLDEVVQDLTVQAFRSAGVLRNVTADASAFASGYWLELDVNDFQAEYSAVGTAPTIRVHLSARLGSAGDRRILASFDATAVQPAAADRLSAIVAAYEKAVDGALAAVVADTMRTLAGVKTGPGP
jgi:cholesterol transport system auxiliary component